MEIKFILLVLVNIASVKCQCDDVSDVTLVLIRGRSAANLDPISIPWSDIKKLLKSPDYNNEKSTLIYAHGFIENYNSSSVQTILQAYMSRRREFNLFLIDWSKFSDGNYFLEAIPNLIKVSASEYLVNWRYFPCQNINVARLGLTSELSSSKCQLLVSMSRSFTLWGIHSEHTWSVK